MEKIKKKLCKNKIPKVNEYIVKDQFDNNPYINRERLFGDRFETVRKESNIRQELCFRDLRRNAILALDEADCNPSEISSISG
jgi:hypothetical protein